MSEALETKRAFFVTHRLPVEAELDDIIAGDQFWASERAIRKRLGSSGCRTLTWP